MAAPSPVPENTTHPLPQNYWLNDLISGSDQEIYVIDEATLTLLCVSAAVCRQLQYRADELAARPVTDVLPDLSREHIARLTSTPDPGTAFAMPVQVTQRRRDGREKSVRLRLARLPVPGASALVAIVDSPAGQAAAQTVAANHQDRIAQIEQHLPELVFQLCRRTSGQLEFCFLSLACEDLLGQPADALYADAQRFIDKIVDNDRQTLVDKMHQSADALAVLNWEGRIWIESWQDFKWINLRATPRDEGADGILWTGLMTNITQGKRQAEELRQSRAQLADLTAHVDNMLEQERERIERDLHDDLGGNLSALKMMLAQVWKQLPQTPFLVERADYLNQLIDRSIESIHRISADLRPSILGAGLVAALEWLAQEQQKQTGIPYVLHGGRRDIDMAPNLATSLFRIAQEACNNIRKHAHASRVDIHLREGDGELVLEVVDNGIGIAEDRRNNPRSFGLLGMAERTSALGGKFKLTSRSGRGTKVRVTLPLRPH